VEHRQVEKRQTTACRASGDDPARFLKELRQLRDGAGLGPAELAARAHYPYDRIRDAEAGPALPDLPVLSAYVRGCGGTTEEWEERWRSLTSAQTLPLLAARPSGSSTAASAGARIGSISPAADTPDPSIILAALDRVAEGMAVGNPAPAPLPSPSGVLLPSQSGASTIEQRPGVEAGAEPGADAAASQPSVWERAAAPTAWETAAAPAEWETDQTAAAGPATANAAPAEPAPAPIPEPTLEPTPTPGPAPRPALSRATILAAIAVVICVLVAALAIFA
jgi:hypothetical protein